MKIFYRFQYCDGTLSMIIKDEKKLIYDCAGYLSVNKKKYPVAIWVIYVKNEA